MAFTIEDMRMIAADKYGLDLLAGAQGWSNSISWILLIEDETILKDFKGKDLAVTTGLGFAGEEKQLALVKGLVAVHASGLIINTGPHISAVPESVISYCNENGFPLMTVPWSTVLYDMIKDLSMRVFFQGAADARIAQALIEIIKDPAAAAEYKKDLLPYFDTDGTFQAVLISTGDLDVMDTVDRQRISYRMQIYLENITHNATFFYYDGCFVLVVNALSPAYVRGVLRGFLERLRRRMPDRKAAVGVGSVVTDVANLQRTYRRARAAVELALRRGQDVLWFDEMGFDRLFSQVEDAQLLREMGEDILRPLLEHDRGHGTNYVETLRYYLESERSVQEAARRTYTHRNTVIYRLNNIKALLGCDLDDAGDRLRLLVACRIVQFCRLPPAGEAGSAARR